MSRLTTQTWRRGKTILVAGYKLATYEVKDTPDGEFGEAQYHMTYMNTVHATLSKTALLAAIEFTERHADLPEEAVVVEEIGHVKMTTFNETQEDGKPWRVLHVYEHGQIRSRGDFGSIKLLSALLIDTKPPTKGEEE